MLAARRVAAVYVDPFDRICHGLGLDARNYRLERSAHSVAETNVRELRTCGNTRIGPLSPQVGNL